jgi:hypothetical protein
MNTINLKGDGNFVIGMVEALMSPESYLENTGDMDHLLIKKNGNYQYDGDNKHINFEDGRPSIEIDGKGPQSSFEALLGVNAYKLFNSKNVYYQEKVWQDKEGHPLSEQELKKRLEFTSKEIQDYVEEKGGDTKKLEAVQGRPSFNLPNIFEGIGKLVATAWNMFIDVNKNNKTENTFENMGYRQRTLEKLGGIEQDSFCMGTDVINLYVIKYGVRNETVESFFNTAVEKGYMKANGEINSNFSQAFAEYAELREYIEYSSLKQALTPEAFTASQYEYGLGGYTKDKQDDGNYHYMLIQRQPFLKNDPGMRQKNYYLQSVRPIWFTPLEEQSTNNSTHNRGNKR